MAQYLFFVAALCAGVTAAPPSPPRLYQQHPSAQLQSLNPLHYFMENQEVAHYYNQAQQKQGSPGGAPARLESLEPDSEVELIPGAQQPQQPPQQAPVAPNLPGLVPGQRVFIVHMPVAGYRPGSIGGYQPVYIVAAAPQGNFAGTPQGNTYATNGYQNAILLNSPGQVVSPFFGYPGAGVAPQAGGSGLVVGAHLFNRGYDQIYQDPGFGYQAGPGPQADGRGVQLTQLIGLQQAQQHQASGLRNAASEPSKPEPQRSERLGEANDESKEAMEPRRNARPSPPHAQSRNKA